MTIFFVGLLTLICAALLVALYLQDRRASRERSQITTAWALERTQLLQNWREERTELMNRVQHPQVFQPRQSDVRPAVQTPDREPSDLDQLARVGGIVVGDFPDN